MGQQIVYCGKCGNSLRHDDFEKGRAVVVDAISYCSTCLPTPITGRAPRPEAARPSISSTKIRTVAGGPPSTRRRVQGADRKSALPLVLGGGAAGVVAIVVLVLLLSGGSPPAPPPPAAAPPAVSAAAATWARLEEFAAAADPDEVLLRCEEAAKTLRGTDYDPQLRALEASVREKKKTRDAERQLAQSLDEARKFMESDHRFTRREEFRRLLDRLLAAPGGHQAEIRRISETWEKQLKERETPPPPPPPTPAPSGALALGPRGEIRQWLVVGTFPNTPGQDGLYADIPGMGSAHVPAAGLQVRRKDGTRIPWLSHSAPEGTVSFRQIAELGAAGSDAPAVAFAACWLVAENATRVKFRVNADTGYRIRLNTEQIGSRPKGFEIGKEFETYTRALEPGPNLVVVRVGAVGAPFGLRVRVTTIPSVTEPAPGVTVALSAGSSGNVLLKEDFEAGRGRFVGGEVIEDGGRKVLAVSPKAAHLEKFTGARVGPATTLRFRFKLPSGIRSFYLMSWCHERQRNHWYHLKGLKSGEWAQATVPLKDLKGGYRMDGPSLEGEVPYNLVFKFDAPAGTAPDPLLIDDVEIVE